MLGNGCAVAKQDSVPRGMRHVAECKCGNLHRGFSSHMHLQGTLLLGGGLGGGGEQCLTRPPS